MVSKDIRPVGKTRVGGIDDRTVWIDPDRTVSGRRNNRHGSGVEVIIRVAIVRQDINQHGGIRVSAGAVIVRHGWIGSGNWDGYRYRRAIAQPRSIAYLVFKRIRTRIKTRVGSVSNLPRDWVNAHRPVRWRRHNCHRRRVEVIVRVGIVIEDVDRHRSVRVSASPVIRSHWR